MQILSVIFTWALVFGLALSNFIQSNCEIIGNMMRDQHGIHQHFESNKNKSITTNISSVLFTTLSGKNSILKKIVLANPTVTSSANREVQILLKVKNNDCFVQFIRCYYYPSIQTVYIQTDHLDGDFSEETETWKSFKNLKEFKDRLRVYIRMAVCLKELHKLGIIHNDIKPKNIVANKDHPETLNIIDFGLSTQDEYENQSGGTYHFMPPEYAQVTHHDDGSQSCQVNDYTDESRDIYALGITFALLEFGKSKVLNGINQARVSNLGKCFQISQLQSIISNNVKEISSTVVENRNDERRAFIVLLDTMVREPTSKRPDSKLTKNNLISIYKAKYGEYVSNSKPKHRDLVSMFLPFFII